MQYIGRRVKHLPQAVTTEIFDHAHAMRFHIGLNGVTNIAKRIARFDRGNPFEQSVMGHLNQPFRFARQCSSHIHAAGVPIPTIDDHSHINIQNIAIFYALVSWNAVADHMIDRNTAGVQIAFIANRGRDRPMCRHHIGDHPVNLSRGLPNCDIRNDVIQNGRSNAPSLFHTGKITGLINSDTIFG